MEYFYSFIHLFLVLKNIYYEKYYYLHFLYLYLLLVMLKIRMILPRLFSLTCQPNSCLLTQDSF